MQLAVEFLFQTAQAVVIAPDVAQHLRGEQVVGVEASKFLLEENSLHVQGFHGGCDLRRDAPRDPGEVMAVVEACGNLSLGGKRVFRIVVDQRSKGARGGLLVGDLRGIGVD